MPVENYNNAVPNSPISDITIYYGKDTDALGPRFTIITANGAQQDYPQSQLAEFLNDTTEKSGSKRILSEDIEQALVKNFGNVLKVENGHYTYTGPSTVDPGHYFEDSYLTSKLHAHFDHLAELLEERAALEKAATQSTEQSLGGSKTHLRIDEINTNMQQMKEAINPSLPVNSSLPDNNSMSLFSIGIEFGGGEKTTLTIDSGDIHKRYSIAPEPNTQESTAPADNQPQAPQTMEEHHSYLPQSSQDKIFEQIRDNWQAQLQNQNANDLG